MTFYGIFVNRLTELSTSVGWAEQSEAQPTFYDSLHYLVVRTNLAVVFVVLLSINPDYH